VYPDGDKQEINHSLMMGDIVDLNGDICGANDLNPRKIAYKVAGCKRQDYFKEITWFYKLELLTASDVEDEINFQSAKKFKDEQLDKIFAKIEKRIAKKNKN
jgi:hypothetical protein